jgi:pyruvate dehydrogenase E1 component alpha subunit
MMPFKSVLKVHDAVQKALYHARKKGPFLLEAITYRYAGHSMGDPERYRSKQEIEEWRTRDPILRFGERLKAEKAADEAALEGLRQAVEAELAASVQFAEESPEPDDAALCEHVFVNPIPHR